MALHNNTHLAPPRPQRDRNLLQKIQTGQNGQTRTPLSTPPLMPHPEHLTQTLTCRHLKPDMAHILHYIYSYLTQGQQEAGLITVYPRAKRIICKGGGLYATPIVQPMSPVAPYTTGLDIYAYLPMNPSCLPQPSPADLVFFIPQSTSSTRAALQGHRDKPQHPSTDDLQSPPQPPLLPSTPHREAGVRQCIKKLSYSLVRLTEIESQCII